ncbi:hypothetical protein [Cryobacterium aureum]|uniref:hypothetical protein n=1 Tax=Cryobacterium aureum TaxID=995037 RepID=UPI00196B72B4|nr:hypothetical protein [Cryobacterium aureum]
MATVDRPLIGKNHDAWQVAAAEACVVDGATPLGDDWPQDLKAFAQAIAGALTTPKTDADSEVWSGAITALRDRFEPAGYRRSAGAALVRMRGDQLVFSTIGDVMCLVQTVDATVRVFDDRLVALDRQSSDVGTRAALIENRARLNQPGGYPIFADDPAAGAEITSLSVTADSVRAFALLSDGAWHHLDDNPVAALDALCATPLPGAFQRQVERSGLPLSDDATIVLFTRSPTDD